MNKIIKWILYVIGIIASIFIVNTGYNYITDVGEGYIVTEPYFDTKVEYNVNISTGSIYTEIVVENGSQYAYNHYYVKLPSKSYNRIWTRLDKNEFYASKKLGLYNIQYYAITNKEFFYEQDCNEANNETDIWMDCVDILKQKISYTTVDNPTSSTNYLEWILIVKADAFTPGSFNFTVRPATSRSTAYIIDPEVNT